ncbi:MAG: flagellar hook-associated protein FlgK, partial [Desulfotomaculales bacterium]
MPGTFFGIEIARRGLNVHCTALETTSHNVANANTPGYTRQEAVISASDPFTIPSLETKLLPGQLGTGVLAEMIRRIKNEYLDIQARDSISSREYWQSQEEIFGRIEAVFPEPGNSGIANTLTKFFNYWQDLNNTPQDPGVKAAVAEAGDELATMMREAYRQLQDIIASILKTEAGGSVTGGQMKDQVDTVNGILTQIRELTESIKLIYTHGNQPNDLLDKRDLLLDQLAEYGPVNVVYETAGGKPTGEIALTFFGADVRPAGVSVSLDYSAGPPEELKLVIGSQEVSLTNYPTGIPKNGSLPGLEEVRGRLASYQNSLNDLSLALASTVNQVHN